MPSKKEAIRAREVRIKQTPELTNSLWAAWVAFNQAIALVEAWLDRLAAGELASNEREVKASQILTEVIYLVEAKLLFDLLNKGRGEQVRSVKSAQALLDKMEGVKEDFKGKFRTELFSAFVAGWTPVKELYQHFKGCYSEVWRQVLTTGLARWKSYRKLLAKWEDDRVLLQARLATFELENPEYMGVRSQFEVLQDVEKEAVRRMVNFLFRKGRQDRLAVLERSLTASGASRKGKGRRPWQFAADLGLLNQRHPELVGFIDLHAEYEGLRLSLSSPPTKTSVHPVSHPMEPVFSGFGKGYRGLKLPGVQKRQGEVVLQAFQQGDSGFEDLLLHLPLEFPERFSVKLTGNGGEIIFWNPQRKEQEVGALGGIRLMCQIAPGGGRTFSLSFLIKQEVAPGQRLDFKKSLAANLAEGARVVAVVPAAERILCFLSATKNGDGLVLGRPAYPRLGGLSVGRLAELSRGFSSKQKRTGKLQEGEQFAVDLAEHRKNSSNSLVDKAVAEAIQVAIGRLPASVVVIPHIEGIRASLYRSSDHNTSLRLLKLATVFSRLKERLQSLGIPVWETSDFGASELCSRCGEIGIRLNLRTDSDGERFSFSRSGGTHLCLSCAPRNHPERVGMLSPVAEVAARNLLLNPCDKARLEKLSGLVKDKDAARSHFQQQQCRAKELLSARGMLQES
jgi:hypothetical protein